MYTCGLIFLLLLYVNMVMCICTYMLLLASYYYFLVGDFDLTSYHFFSVTVNNNVRNQLDVLSSHLLRKKGLISPYPF